MRSGSKGDRHRVLAACQPWKERRERKEREKEKAAMSLLTHSHFLHPNTPQCFYNPSHQMPVCVCKIHICFPYRTEVRSRWLERSFHSPGCCWDIGSKGHHGETSWGLIIQCLWHRMTFKILCLPEITFYTFQVWINSSKSTLYW